MPDKGWIKLHRKVLDCWIWNNKPYDKARAWIDLLLLAMHHDKKIMLDDNVVTVIPRGCYMTSVLKLAERWGWSRNKVKRFLDVLECEQMLTTKRTNIGTLVTIVNYDVYQVSEQDDEPTGEPTDEPPNEPPDEPQNKNIKNEKNINIRSNSDDLNESDKPKKKKTKLTEEENEELVKNFEIIYNSYPKKVGKTAGFELYKQWLNGRDILGKRIKLTNRQIWLAIARYKKQLEDNETEKQFIKQFDTFMRKPILDYIGDEEQ